MNVLKAKKAMLWTFTKRQRKAILWTLSKGTEMNVHKKAKEGNFVQHWTTQPWPGSNRLTWMVNALAHTKSKLDLHSMLKKTAMKGSKCNFTLYSKICSQLGQITIKTVPQLSDNWKNCLLIWIENCFKSSKITKFSWLLTKI